MNKKNILAIVAFVIVVVLLVIGISRGANKVTGETIKIGAVYPLTGALAFYGGEYKKGVEMAVNEINETGGIKGKKVEVIFEDDGNDVTRSVTAVRKLINTDKVKYLLTCASSQSQATAPIAEENKIVYISTTVSKIGTGNYVFRDYWDVGDVGNYIGKALVKDNMKKVGIIALNFGDTETYLQALKSSAVGVEFLEEKFNFGDSDFRTQLTKIKTFNPDAIIVYAFPGADASIITKQIKDFGLDNRRLYSGMTTYVLPFMYEPFKEILVRMKVVDNNYDLSADNKKAVEFRAKYQTLYGTNLLTSDSAYAYDDIYALKQALEKSKDINDTKEVADNLRQVKMSGAAGELSFDSLGNSLRSTYLQTLTDNGWVKY